MMKNVSLIYVMSLLLFVACKDKSDSRQAYEPSLVYLEYSDVQANGDSIKHMRDYVYTDSVVSDGSLYVYTIKRAPCNSTVTDTDGLVYQDNTLALDVQKNNMPFFSHTFTKTMLSQYVDKNFMSRSILEGLAFDNMAADGMRFSLSIGLPLSDEYVQLRVTISCTGQMTVRRDEIVDDNLADDDSLNVAC